MAISVFAGLLLGVCLIWAADLVIPDRDEALDGILDHHDRDNTLVFAREGELIAEVFSEYRIYVPYSEIPQTLINAVLAIEDRNFFTHRGFDLQAMFRALIHNLKVRRISQGASTITQQVVKNYSLSRKKKFRRKIKEILLAIELERVMSKERILTIYLNNLFLGNRSYGAEAAAYSYFGKPLHKLNLAESAMIAGLFRSPSKHDPTRFPQLAKKRQRQVLQAMVETGHITASEMQQAASEPLTFQRYRRARRGQSAPYFVDHVVKRAADILQWPTVSDQGLRIYTTLDLVSQKQASHIVANMDKLRVATKGMEVALLSVNPNTGEILTMIGGRDYRKSKFNRTLQALRPPGSAFKPIVYSYALSQGISWHDINFIAPIAIDAYRPRERRQEFLKETTLYRSFYKSLNLPVIDLTKKFGLKHIITHAHNLGIDTPLKDEMGTVLGGSDLRMIEMANVYSVFANTGFLVTPIAITRIEDRAGKVLYIAPQLAERRRQVLSEQISYLMTVAMKDVFRRGTASHYQGFSRWAAGKTGTSDEGRDSWFCGYSRDRVTVVWLGKDDFSPNSKHTFGATVALPVWAEFMATVTKPSLRRDFPIPTGVVAARVNPRYGHLDASGIRMYFLVGRAPTRKHSPYEALSKNPDFRGFFK